MYLIATMQVFLFLAQEGADTKSSLSALILFPIMLVIMYFLVIQPQRKEEKNKKAMIAALKGDSVITTSGIHGKVVEFKDNNESVVLNVAKDTNITFSANTILKKKP